jgi:hypothetical protein
MIEQLERYRFEVDNVDLVLEGSKQVRTQIALRRSCSFQEHLRLSMESFAHIRIQYTGR